MRSDLIVFQTRFLTRLTFLAVLSLLFVGCGGGDSSGESSADTGDSSAQEAIQNETEAAMGMPGAEGGEHGMEGMAGMEGMPGGEAAAGGEVAMPDDAAMMAGMEAGYAGEPGYTGGPGMNGMPGGQPQKPARPADVAQWTEDQLMAAVEERDPKVLQAIHVHAENAKGDPKFAELMTRVLQMDGGAPGAGGPGAAAPNANPAVPNLQGTLGGGAAAAEPAGDSSGAEAVPANDPAAGAPTRSGPASPAAKGQSLQPPGGASLERPMDSLEVMLGQSLLSYVPQAAQATRGAINNLQGNVNAAGADPAMNAAEANAAAAANSGGAAMPGVDAAADPTMMQEMEGGYNGYPGGPGYEGGPGQRNGALDSQQLVKAVAHGLVINNTPAAWDMLKGIAAGTVATPVTTPEAIEIVLSEVFSAEAINVPVAQQLLMSALQTVASNPAQHESTIRFLAALAQNPTDYFLKMWTAAPPAGPVPGGVPGSMGGMNNMAGGEMDPGMMEAGAAGGEGMMAGAMMSGGMPGGGMMGGRLAAAAPPLPQVRISEAAMLPIATALWSEVAVGAVVGQLSAASDPLEVPHLLAFASTIPSDAARQSLYTLFSKAHEQGATPLQALGLFRNIARDPGMLTVLKSLPRPKRARKKADDEPEVVDPSTSWSAATQDVVLSLRDRLRGVASDSSLAYDGLQRLRLHRDAVAEQSIVIKVPDDRSQSLGAAAPAETTIYYTSTTVKPLRFSDMQKIVDHYETRSKGIKHEDRARGILWYDAVKSNDDGTVETTDVIVEVVGGGGQQQQQNYEGAPGVGGGGQEMPTFRIEVIVVITRDPTTSASGTAAAAPGAASTDQ